MRRCTSNNLEALAVNDGRAALIVLGLRDPHLLEGGERGKNRTSNPDGVLTLGRSDDLDLHGGRGESSEFLGHTFTNTLEHSGTTGENDVSVEILTDIDITLHDGLEGGIVDTRSLLSDEVGLEEDLRTTETLVTNSDDVTIGELVGLLVFGCLDGLLHLSIEIEGAGKEKYFEYVEFSVNLNFSN